MSTGKHMAVRRRKTRWPYIFISLILVIAILWVIAVYSQIPFVKRMRDIYIETAMSTLSHKWLATAFIPADVVADTMRRAEEVMEASLVEESELPPAPVSAPAQPEPAAEEPVITPLPSEEEVEEKPDPALTRLLTLFDELDPTTIPKDFAQNYALDTLQIKDILSLGIKTTAGDEVWAIDAVNGILIMVVRGSFLNAEFYEGKLALIKDSGKVSMAMTSYADRGENLQEYCRHNNAILGINANGFDDPEGKGKAYAPMGLVIAGGKRHGRRLGGYYSLGGFDNDDNFRVGSKVNVDEMRDCAEFMPVVVLNGESNVKGTGGYGNQPRTVIGQSVEKEALFLIIDGRQPGYSVGATPQDCAEILLRYGCWAALCMDGGSSSYMAYDGEIITRSSSPQEGGRFLPCAWLVSRAAE
ncbi:MAG: phosphodiester glycosidase family protein [bacterium]